MIFMFRQILGLIDIMSGIVLIIRPELFFIRILTFFCLGKGIWSLLSSFAMGYFTDWMGAIDTLAGICLFLLMRGSSFVFFTIVGVVMIVKGLYSLV